jgi:predicted DNA-binding mobile mystery protein A
MSKEKKLMRRALDKKITTFEHEQTPPQGWIRTIREAIGMTTSQLAKRLKISQPRVTDMEKNENNLKLSTLEKVASALNCRLVYAFVPQESLDAMVQTQARKAAHAIMQRVNNTMTLEDQAIDITDQIEDTVNELINEHLNKIWDFRQ